MSKEFSNRISHQAMIGYQRVETNEQARISRDGFKKSLKRRRRQCGIELKHPVMNCGIDRLAELNEKSTFSDGPIARKRISSL